MFHMMNEARIGVGLTASALACTGYAAWLAVLDPVERTPLDTPAHWLQAAGSGRQPWDLPHPHLLACASSAQAHACG